MSKPRIREVISTRSERFPHPIGSLTAWVDSLHYRFEDALVVAERRHLENTTPIVRALGARLAMPADTVDSLVLARDRWLRTLFSFLRNAHWYV